MGTFSTMGNYTASANGKKLDPRVIEIMKQAAAQSPYNVVAFSGVAGRSAGTTNHPGGYAMDVYLQDPTTGKLLTNYGGANYQHQGTMAGNFPAYETFAQTARVVQQQSYPELNNTFRWGGYFGNGKGNTGPDLMHFDINPKLKGATGAGSWDTGMKPEHAAQYGLVSNGGLSKNPTLVAQIKAGTGLSRNDIVTAYTTQPHVKSAAADAITRAINPQGAKAPLPQSRPAALSGQTASPFAGSQAAIAAHAAGNTGGNNIVVHGGATAPAPAAAPVKLASGGTIAPGVYPSNDGKHQVQVTDDGHGNAVVTKINNPGEIPGVIDPLHEPSGTIAGHIVQSTIRDVAAQKAKDAAAATKAAVTAAAPGVGATLGNAAGTVGNFFGNLFKGAPVAPNSSGSPDDRNHVAPAAAPAAPSNVFSLPQLGTALGGLFGGNGGNPAALSVGQTSPVNAFSRGSLAASGYGSAGNTGVGSLASLVGRDGTIGMNVIQPHQVTNVQPSFHSFGSDVMDSHGHPANVQQSNYLAPAPVAQRPSYGPATAAGSALQQALGSYYTGNQDGIYGPKTDAAVRAFQAANGLKVDGIVGPKTIAALQPHAAPAPAPAPAPVYVPPAPQYQSNNNGGGNIAGFDANTGTWSANDAPGQHGSNHDAAH